MIHLGLTDPGWSNFLSDGLAPHTGTAQSQGGDVLILPGSRYPGRVDGELSVAGPAHAARALGETVELKRDTAFADCFLSNPCYDTLRSNHRLYAWHGKWSIRSSVKIFKQLVSFVLGVAAGACLHSVLTLRPLSPKLLSSFSPSARANDGVNRVRPPWVQRTLPAHVAEHAGIVPRKDIDLKPAEVGPHRARVKPEAEPVELAASVLQPAEAAAVKPVEAAVQAEAQQVAASIVAPMPPPPTVFKTIGYVEKAGGEVEGIILQENQIQVVQLGDLIADRYRVTKVSPDSVDASDEMQAQSPMIEPSVKKSEESTASVTAPPSNPPALVAPPPPGVLPGAGSVDHLRNIQNAPPGTPPPAVAEFQPTSDADNARDDETSESSDPANASLGFVETASGKVEVVLADGNSVRLVSQAPAGVLNGAFRQASFQILTPVSVADYGSASAWADRNSAAEPGVADRGAIDPAVSLVSQVASDGKGGSAKSLFSFKPMGFVEQSDGELEAIVSEDDEVYLVGQGDRFADHYRAVSVSPDAVEAMDEPRRPVVPFRNLDASAARQVQSETNTFIFQALGYVETEDGDLEAVVADGSQIYLVRQGKTFAGQYLATSVDPVLVLAVKAPQSPATFLTAQTESGGKLASKNLVMQLPLFAWAGAQASHDASVSSSAFLTELGVNLLNSR